MITIKKTKYKKQKLTKINGVEGSVKKFDKKLHSKYDIDAREMLKNVLKDNIKDNEDQYGEDMIFTISLTANNKKFPFKYLEVQVFSKWDGARFPYICPFVYARKMRFSDETLFVTFNKFLSEAIIFSKNSLDKNPSRLKKYDRELIHYVNWGKTMTLKSNEITIKNILLYSGEDIDEIEDIDKVCNIDENLK